MKSFQLAVLILALFATPMHAAMSKSDAKKVLEKSGFALTPQDMLAALGLDLDPAIIEAFLTLGILADREITYEADGGEKLTRYPLTYLLMFSCAGEDTPAKAKLLLDAGADPNTRDPENDWTTLMQAYGCPDVIRVLLDGGADPNLIDGNGNTAMHYVVRLGGDRQIESIRMLLDAGYDFQKWRTSLLEEAKYRKPVLEMLQAVGAAPRTAPTPRKNDWRSLPPYPQWSKAEATKLLARPGAVTTIDEHMWDGITQREPMRLAAALGAGANVHQTRAVTGYTPLVLLTERCDDDDAEILTANAELLIAAGADLNGVDANGENALMLAADDCPIGVVQALLRAGVSPHGRAKTGATALRNAISEGRADVVAALLDAGVDPRKEPYNARALASGKPEIEALLKKRR